MRQFFKYMLVLLGMSILVAVLCDAVYTAVFYKTVPRNKLQFVLKNKNLHYNNVFLGSSRVANHIDILYLDSISGEKNLNLGVEGANYGDNLLTLKIFIENDNKVQKVFLQLDHFYESNEMNAIASSDALPFIHNDIIANHFQKYDKKYYEYYYIPFFRYLSADFKIGFREFFMSLINKQPRINLAKGFIPKYGVGNSNKREELPNKLAGSNVYVEEISKLCKEKKIKLVFFCAPFCSYTPDFTYIKKLQDRYPTLNDYSRSLDDKFFINCTHLNNVGAKEFTHLIYEKNLKND